ncbi:MAG TPA: hypothetical protein VHD56_01895 [Tepidisphaeraceae bacterium]|nr:hypothetical protein [Tepidisphaeraceae bacterium]
MSYLLVIFGFFVLIISSLLIVMPYVRGRADLVTAWTVFQISCLNFLGVASIQTGRAWTHQYTTPRDSDYVKYALGGLAFYVTVIFTYYFFSFPDRVASRTMVKVAPRVPRVMTSLLPVCLALTLGYVFVPNIQLLGQWMMIVGKSSAVFAVVFCFCAWAQRPWNTWLVVLAGMFMLMAVLASNTEFGRRDFLACLMSVPICWYWLRGRYLSAARVGSISTVFIVIGGIALAGVSITRHMYRNPDQSVFQAAWEKVKAIPDAFQQSGGNTDVLWGSDCAEASLAAIRLYDHSKPTKPFLIAQYVLAHPIPRAWWPDKPDGLGRTLPIDTGWTAQHGAGNWGPGIIGHGYQEGGIPFLVFYGILAGWGLRFFDAMLKKDPNNPYLLGIFAAASGQLIAWCRGDVALFTATILGVYVAGFLVNYLARLMFWTDHLGAVTVEQLPPEYAEINHSQVDWQYY